MMFDIKMQILTPLDVSPDYVTWFKDTNVTRYSDNQYRDFSLSGQISYIEDCHTNENIVLYGIFCNNFHIGNVQFVGLKSQHKRIDVSYLIGDRKFWGKGLGKYSVMNAIHKVNDNYDVNKFTAGAASGNIASIRVLEHCGFEREAVRKDHLIYCGNYYDQIDFALFSNQIGIRS